MMGSVRAGELFLIVSIIALLAAFVVGSAVAILMAVKRLIRAIDSLLAKLEKQ